MTGLSQTFSDQDASRMRRRHGLTSGYRLGFKRAEFLSIVVPTQVRQSAIPPQIGLGKTLRQAHLRHRCKTSTSVPRRSSVARRPIRNRVSAKKACPSASLLTQASDDFESRRRELNG